MRISDWSSDVCSSCLFKGDCAGNVPQAIAAFKRAVSEDPDFALAWAKLSSERAVARYWGVDQSEANLQAMELEAKRALELAPRLSEAHAAMGFVQRFLHRSEEHTSELQSLMRISYAVFCLKKKTQS